MKIGDIAFKVNSILEQEIHSFTSKDYITARSQKYDRVIPESMNRQI
jgi:hypothetical protein